MEPSNIKLWHLLANRCYSLILILCDKRMLQVCDWNCLIVFTLNDLLAEICEVCAQLSCWDIRGTQSGWSRIRGKHKQGVFHIIICLGSWGERGNGCDRTTDSVDEHCEGCECCEVAWSPVTFLCWCCVFRCQFIDHGTQMNYKLVML